MKKLIIGICVCLGSTLLLAKEAQYLFIYSNLPESSIERCQFTDSVTAVTMTYRGTPKAWFTFASSTFASDERGVRHKVLRADGLMLDGKRWLGDRGEATFTLYFDPLPKDTKVFDIIEGNLVNGFQIYGIHRSHEILDFPSAKESIDTSETDASLFRKDTTVIRGHITNYDRSMPHILRVQYPSPIDGITMHEKGLNYAKIKPDGTFQVTFLLDTPRWSELTFEFIRNIPFYAHPGDTLDLRIDNYGAWNEAYTYHSVKGYPTHQDLIQCPDLLIRRRLSDIQEKESYKEFAQEMAELDDDVNRFLRYWGWKYRLSPWERHLLSSNWRLRHVMTLERYRIGKMQEINSILRQNGNLSSDIPEGLYSRTYLQDVDWNDSSLMITPAWSWHFVQELNRSGIPTFKKAPAASPMELYPDNRIERWTTYRVSTPKAQLLVDSLVSRSASSYSVLLLTRPGKNEDRHLNDFLNLASEFEGEDFHFVLVVSKGHSVDALRDLLSKIRSECQYQDVDVDICVIEEEQMIDLQAAFQSINIPFNATLTRQGLVLYSTLATYGDEPRRNFRDLLKHDRTKD